MNSSDVLNRLTSHKRSQAELVQYLATARELLAMKVNDCGSWLHLREWLNGGESRLINANFCKQFLLCRSCAARRAGRLVGGYQSKVEAVMASSPLYVPAMMTLTVRNGPDLEERMEHLKEAAKTMWAKRRKGLSNSGRHAAVEACKVQGAVKAMEVTKSESGWHPHLHLFCLLTEYIDQNKLSEEWHAITGDSFVVGITKCKNGIVPGLVECLKYASKISELTPAEALEVHDTAKGSRLTDAMGCLRGVKEPDIDADEVEDSLTGPYRDYIAHWLYGKQAYELRPYEKALYIERPEKTMV